MWPIGFQPYTTPNHLLCKQTFTVIIGTLLVPCFLLLNEQYVLVLFYFVELNLIQEIKNFMQGCLKR